jgi:hypothetical protein
MYLPPTSKACERNPCGINAICRERDHAAACICKPGYFGDPYVSCQLECLMNSHCALTQACVRNKCVNPCNDMCTDGNSECSVINHRVSCSCKQGYTGNPFDRCTPIPSKILFPNLLRLNLISLILSSKN